MLQFLNDNTGILKDVVFCFTGKFIYPQTEMETLAINAGAKVTRSVNSKTTILVIADANSKSCKAESARDRDIYLISPSQFLSICKHVTKSNGDNPISQIHIKTPSLINKPTEKRKHSSIRHIQL